MAGLKVSALFTGADGAICTACVALPKRSDEEQKSGTPAALAASRMRMVSASEPAIGLSMKTGLCAARTGFTCSRWTRPSFDSGRRRRPLHELIDGIDDLDAERLHFLLVYFSD